MHLVSDATGETLNAIARAALAQFEGVVVNEHFYALVRSERQLQRALEHIKAEPGLVFFTLVNQELRQNLQRVCATLSVRPMTSMEAPIATLRDFLGSGAAETHRPGGQHDVDQKYLHPHRSAQLHHRA